ncbi:helix-turn-helix transcriptional regulator [Caenispirillum bisanense]|uniref:DNA-binding transcriptional regulator, CsgD family n=1 Tax=Caenispirillum bisanense TaxID=414052 RepID=A0A286GJX2_9PROT|nr:helix-turn-helix transcriptional regulator [Caenispirillum bisanense]SOD95800.1 DNA-binding transcriptional regulator, CsgD family [Caenispirillum bisanense]
MTSGETVHVIIDKIYDGAVQEQADAWQDAMAMIEHATGGLVTLTLEDTRVGSVDVFVAPSLPPAAVESYSSHFFRVNPWLPLIPEHPGDQPLDGDALLDPHILLASEYYTDWLKPQGLRYAIGADLFREPGRVMLLSILLAPDNPPTDSHFALLRTLQPHLRRAAQVRRQLADAWAARSSADAMLERIATAVLLLDGGGRVVALNDRARRLVEARRGLDIDGRQHLQAAAAAAREPLRRRIASALAVGSGGAGGVLAVPCGPEEERLHVLVAPTGSGRGWLGIAAPAVAVFVHDPAATGRPSPERLAELFGLTQAEGRVLAELAIGASVQEVASRSGVAVSTVRHHLKQLFGKTGVNRQAELVRLVLQDPVTRSRRHGPGSTG